MITENIDVVNSMANGSMCRFIGIKMKHGLGPEKIGYVNIDGYYVQCVDAEDLEYIEVELQEHKKKINQD